MFDGFSDWMERYPNWITSFWFSDEAHFHFNGAINNHNNNFSVLNLRGRCLRYFSGGPKTTSFCALNARWNMLGPNWFEDANGKVVTVNGERYHEILHQFHTDLVQLLSPNPIRLAWFMQDGSPLHTVGETIDLFHQLFGNRVISLDTAHEWAPHNPDLNFLEFLFWGTAKGQVYTSNLKPWCP